MDKSEIPFSIFIDLSKAFDILDHNILINKLQYSEIKGTALDLFQSYLSNRRQYVQFGNNKSDTTEITTGVPQGSIPGPQLFIIYINDIIKSSTLFHTIIYGSFCVKSPNELNPTVSDFNETWYTCCLGTHSTKSKILGQSDQWCGRYGPPQTLRVSAKTGTVANL